MTNIAIPPSLHEEQNLFEQWSVICNRKVSPADVMPLVEKYIIPTLAKENPDFKFGLKPTFKKNEATGYHACYIDDIAFTIVASNNQNKSMHYLYCVLSCAIDAEHYAFFKVINQYSENEVSFLRDYFINELQTNSTALHNLILAGCTKFIDLGFKDFNAYDKLKIKAYMSATGESLSYALHDADEKFVGRYDDYADFVCSFVLSEIGTDEDNANYETLQMLKNPNTDDAVLHEYGKNHLQNCTILCHHKADDGKIWVFWNE